MRHILHKPVITENSMKQAANGRFTFLVDIKSTKGEISKEIEKQFKVHVRGIRTMIVAGKTKRVGKKRTLTVLSDTKKAIVKLDKNEKIDLFPIEQLTNK